MSRAFLKFKLLLDENMPPRKSFSRLNHLYDVKHIAMDFKKSGIEDQDVYAEAVKKQRIIVTFNGDDFKDFAMKSQNSGVISISTNLSNDDIDKKLVALLSRSTPRSLYGKLTPLTGET